jgi:glycosyltransferase involved in cell wall biosynthesis
MKPARVCMVTYLFPPVYSGAGVQALRLAKELEEKGVAVSILTARHRADLPVQESVEGISVRRLPVLRAGRLRPLSFSLATAYHLLWHRRHYDVVHIHGAYWRILPVLLVAGLTAKKSVVKMTQLGTDDPQTIRQRRFGRALYRSLALADAVVSTSRDLTLSYRRSALPSDKLVQIPNGVDTAVFRPGDDAVRGEIRIQLDLSQNTRLVVFVGRVGYRKGADVLLRAWAEVAGECPDAWLVLLGPVGEDVPTLDIGMSIDCLLSDTPRAFVLGHRANVQDYLRAADIFVLPTRMEGLPNALLEAMATGLPCIASDVGGNTDLIVDEENGLLFETGSVEQLAGALLRLVRDQAKRRALGHRARETIEVGYSMDRVVKKYMELYHSLLGSGTDG